MSAVAALLVVTALTLMVAQISVARAFAGAWGPAPPHGALWYVVRTISKWPAFLAAMWLGSAYFGLWVILFILPAAVLLAPLLVASLAVALPKTEEGRSLVTKRMGALETAAPILILVTVSALFALRMFGNQEISL
ncbi:MAG TPA: hypothetical protein VGB70_12840 [Allosphingosinicella sp.]|jgi:hypothetical protein